MSGLRLFDDPSADTKRLFAFTDGSTCQSQLCNVGYAAVFAREGSLDVVEKVSGVFRPSFNNYVAESLAVLAALHVCPQHIDLTIVTDSMALIWAIYDPVVAEQKRFRRGCRPMLVTIRKIISERRGLIRITHVNSHTGRTDVMHRGNALADAEAVRARVEGKHEKVQHFLEHEERVIVWVRSGNLLGTEKGAGLKPIHVHGDLRKSLRRVTRELYFEGWCELKHQGRIPREHGDGLRDQIEFVRKMRDHKALWTIILAACKHIPTASIRARATGAARTSVGQECKWCNTRQTETPDHVWSCKRNAAMMAALECGIGNILDLFACGVAVAGATSQEHDLERMIWANARLTGQLLTPAVVADTANWVA